MGKDDREMNQQRIILVSVIAVSVLIGITFQEVFALKDSNWFNAKDFYKKIRSIDIFDDYPYEESKVNVKVIHVSDKPIKRDFIVQYGKDTLVIEGKEFKKDKEAKVSFYIDDGEKKKVCMMSYKDNYEVCKKFHYDGDNSKVTFYIN